MQPAARPSEQLGEIPVAAAGRKQNWSAVIALTLAAVAMFLLLLGRRDITTSHEARVAQTARHMAASGWPWDAKPIDVPPTGLRAEGKAVRLAPLWNDPPWRVNPWVTPVFLGQIRLQKPPLPYWCAAVLDQAMGATETAARLTPALLGAVGTLLMFGVARRLMGEDAGYVAAAVWVSTVFIPSEYRKAMADPFLASSTLLGLWAWLAAGDAKRDGRKLAAVITFYVAVGLGALSKGPLIFLHLGAAMAALAWCGGRRARAPLWQHAIGVVIALAIALPWPWLVLNHLPEARQFWRHELFGGVGGEVENPRPWFFYLGSLFQITLPWTPLWIVGVVQLIAGKRRDALFPLVWTAMVIVVMSVSSQKKNAYLLPILPAQALIVTQAVLSIAAPAGGVRERRIAIVQTIVTAALLVVVIVSATKLHHDRADRVLGIGFAAAGLVAVVFSLRNAGRPCAWLKWQVAAAGLMSFAMMNFIDTAVENARSAKAFAQRASTVLTADSNVLVPNVPGEAAFYLPLELHYDPRAETVYAVAEGSPRGETPEALVKFYNSRLAPSRATAAKRVPLPGDQADERWKIIKVTTAAPE